jgi:choline dehydrogenase-like flavoprotein
MTIGGTANTGDSFDYIIVGSGAAGSLPAHRLTEHPGATMCMLVTGPPSIHPRAGRHHQDAVQPNAVQPRLHLAVQDRAV